MIQKIGRRRFLQNHPLVPHNSPLRVREFYPKTFDCQLLTVPDGAVDYYDYCNRVGAALQPLAAQLSLDYFYFVADNANTWIRSDGYGRVVAPAVRKLATMGVGADFKGVLRVPAADFALFIPPLLPLILTNTIIPYIYFIDDAQTLLGSFCQYGNLHLSALKPSVTDTLRQAAAVAGWVEVPDRNCNIHFPLIKPRSARTSKKP